MSDYFIIKAGQRSLGYSKLSVSDSAVGINAPSGANKALIIIEGGAVRFRDDGTDPTNTDGLPLFQNQSITIETTQIISAMKFIKSGSNDATLHINFYKI